MEDLARQLQESMAQHRQALDAAEADLLDGAAHALDDDAELPHKM
jgi:hypothetical protein